MVEGALDGESRAPGSSSGSDTDFLQQINEPGGLGPGGLMPFPTLKLDGSGKVVSPPDGDGYSVSTSCWCHGGDCPRLSLPHTQPCIPRAMALMNPRCLTEWPGGPVGSPPQVGSAPRSREHEGKRNGNSEGQALGWGHSWSG